MWKRIGVVGSREYPHEDRVRATVAALLMVHGPEFTLVSGGARGVDTWAEDQARIAGWHTDILPAKWDLYGKAAGMMRNAELVQSCDYVYIFWDGKSPGSRNVISLCKKNNVPFVLEGP